VGRAVALAKEEQSTINWALISFSDLRIRWEWHPLRNGPRFQKILDGPRPKTLRDNRNDRGFLAQLIRMAGALPNEFLAGNVASAPK